MSLRGSLAARFALLAGAVSLLALGLAGTAAATPAAIMPAAEPGVPVPLFPELLSVWCSGAGQCLAVGTADGVSPASAVWDGKTWRFLRTPAAGRQLTDLSCSSFTNCMAVGESGVADHWNGSSWRLQSTPVSANLTGVACPDRGLCVAVDGTAKALIWQGRRWRTTSVPAPPGSRNVAITLVSCWSATGCLAYGRHDDIRNGNEPPMAAAWNGTKWHLVAMPPELSFVLACPGRSHCIGIGEGWTQLWNGRSWRVIHTSWNTTYAPFSCASSSFCRIELPDKAFAWNGRSWSRVSLPPAGDVPGLWCGSASDCMAVGGNASQWNGTSWTSMRFSKTSSFGAVSCSRTAACVATGHDNASGYGEFPLAEQWDGTSWRLIARPAPPNGILGPISCPTSSFCMTLGYRWNGHRWIKTQLPAEGGGLAGLSCASSTDCVATGINVAMAWNGMSWRVTNAGIPGQYVDLQSVSCSAAMCMAIGFNLASSCPADCPASQLAEEWNGTSWHVSTDASTGTYIPPASYISCPAATFCLAENETSAIAWQNQTWTPVQSTSPAFDTALSCASPTSCMAIVYTQNGRLLEAWNGTGWTVTTTRAPGSLPIALSCAGPDTCMLAGVTADDLAMAQLWDGTSWSLLNPISP